jgi:MEKHLA domain
MPEKLARPSPENGFQEAHVLHLLECLKIRSGIDLVRDLNIPAANAGEYVFNAPFFLISQDAQEKPVLTYGNGSVLRQWEATWEQLMSMESSKTANTANQAQRNEAMERVAKFGYVTDYGGDRVSLTGKEFSIQNGIIWNLFDLNDAERHPTGRAAFFATVSPKAG